MKNDSLNPQIKHIRNILLILLFVVLFFLLNQLSYLILPLILASLLAMLYYPIVEKLSSIGIPRWIIIPFIVFFTIGLILIIGIIVIGTIQEMVDQQDFFYQQFLKRIESLLHLINSKTKYDINQKNVSEYLKETFNRETVTNIVKNTAKNLGSFGSSFFLFAIYFILLLAGVSRYKAYIHYVGGGKESVINLVEVLQKTISTYMGIKTIISLATGTIAFLICFLFGIKFALFWGFLTFILNFIPTIGSIIATIPPIVMGFIQFDTFGRTIFLSICLVSMQAVIGNIIDPIIMGDRLRLNTITVIFGLVFWGIIWGIPGMLLSVPLMVTIKVILEKSETWSMLARAMTSKEKKTRSRFRRKKKKDINGSS